ncbi:MAG: methionyl-tRNA formyltransferase [Candidatus Cryosericum sp.]
MASETPRVALFGSSAISVPVFEAIRQRCTVPIAVISEEPRVRHGRELTNPVQVWAQSHAIPVFNGALTPNPALVALLSQAEIDILFLLAYGRLLPSDVLNVPLHGSINLHPSPLPWYRGAAPIERQIMDGRTKSAVSIIRMNALLDRGELLAQQPFDIHPTDYRPDVEASIVRVGVPLVLDVFGQLMAGTIVPLPQSGEGSYARKVKTGEEIIDWSLPTARVYNLIRALAPDPGASTFQGAARIKILRASPLSPPASLPPSAPPGQLIALDRKRAAVRCGDGWLEPLQLQFPGKAPASTLDLLNGRRLQPGTIFAEPSASLP